MSMALTVAAFKSALTPFRRSTCTRLTAASSWVTSSTFACHYESASPKFGETIDYAGSGGYGYNVYPDEAAAAVTLVVGDRITVDGYTFEVQDYPPLGNDAGARRAVCIKR